MTQEKDKQATIREDITTNEAARAISKSIVEGLSKVIEPDLGVDIYNLGMIYRVELDENRQLDVDLTLTSPTCHCAEIMPGDIEQTLLEYDGIDSVKVNIVLEPQWNLNRISYYGRIALGIKPS